MPSSEKSDELDRYADGKLEIDDVEPTAQHNKDARRYSVGGRQYSTSGRRLSQWDAMIVAREEEPR